MMMMLVWCPVANGSKTAAAIAMTGGSSSGDQMHDGRMIMMAIGSSGGGAMPTADSVQTAVQCKCSSVGSNISNGGRDGDSNRCMIASNSRLQ